MISYHSLLIWLLSKRLYLSNMSLPRFLQEVTTSNSKLSSRVLAGKYAKINEIENTNLKGWETPAHPYCVLEALKESNLPKNRYSDIIPYDRNRIKLQEVRSNMTDYINASYVAVPNSDREYIATQGPKPNTIGDFWQMVWEQRSRVIVMLTKVEESGRIKCEPYWPTTTQACLNFPEFGLTISMLEEKYIADDNCIVRVLRLKRSTPSQDGVQELTVTQYHTLDWPDHGVQSHPQSILDLIKLSNQEQKKYELDSQANGFKCGPVVVHCSAGCGRTGTFCTIDTALSLLPKLEDDSIDIIFGIVMKFREQRRIMVQTAKQYEFCYVALLTELLSRNKSSH
ncbi:tyrosine protein phosphatase 1 [Basidiobolus ranarum]|uniref:Tyrosine protein phosphatase 1 n=1 Tax=Basidiobolus ranarum TaxID=34480 RepID=A0ABR2WFX4_9FUNG